MFVNYAPAILAATSSSLTISETLHYLENAVVIKMDLKPVKCSDFYLAEETAPENSG